LVAWNLFFWLSRFYEMKFLVYSLLLIILLSLNLETARFLNGTGVTLNFLFLIVVFASLESRDYSFLFVAFLAGLLIDFYNAAPFGSFLFSFILLASLLNWVARTFWVYELNFRAVAIFLGIAFVVLEILIWLGRMNANEFSGGIINNSKSLALSLVYGLPLNLIVAVPIYALWRFMQRSLEKMENTRVFIK
jgi:cell shape-determining protein MreD